MWGRYLKILPLFFVLNLVLLVQIPRTAAQSDEALARIDQAMAHLSAYLERPIDRANYDWRWSELIFPNNSLGCPLDGQDYLQQQIRAYQIRIFVDGTEYDYRLSAEGQLLVLCIDGYPDPSSVGVPVPEAPIEDEIVDSVSENLRADSPWWAWIYAIELDTLYLLNPLQGERLALPRPHLPDEVTGVTPQLAISRDGRILIVANALRSGVNGIGFYSLETGNFIRTHSVRPGEDIFLGFGYDNSNIAGSPYLVSPDNRFLAIGLASTDFSNPSWRVLVFDLNTGDALYQIEGRNPQIATLGAEFVNPGIVFPRIIYVGQDEVHFQLIRYGAGAEPAYPAILWQPNRNLLSLSPYTRRYVDVLPGENAQQVSAFVQEDVPTTTDGLFPSNNAIGTGNASVEAVYVEGGAAFSSPQWAADGDVVLFRRATDSGLEWQLLNIGAQQPTALDADIAAVYGTPQGYLVRSTSGEVRAINIATNQSLSLWQAPQNIQSLLLWVNPPESDFALDQVFIPLNLTGIVHCPDTPSSVVAIGFEAFTTVSLRLRDNPGGEYLLTMNEETEFIIIGGPQCQGTFTWWQIRLEDGTTGWAAEADENFYFIQPVPGAQDTTQ